MKTISFINLKGGVGKTISAINFAHILATVHGKKILLADNDGQGNASRFFGVYDNAAKGTADLLTAEEDVKMRGYISTTDYANIDIIPANLNLLAAEKQVLIDVSRPQQTRLRNALQQVSGDYDYCIIDNAPSLGMAVINALVTTDDVMIPVKVDKFTFDGVEQILKQIKALRAFNGRLRVAGAFVTMYAANKVNNIGIEALAALAQTMPEPLRVFRTAIRQTVRVQESTFKGKPLLLYAKNSTATKDYLALVGEYLL